MRVCEAFRGIGAAACWELHSVLKAEMCLLRAISHCLTWHGAGHPRVCAMKGFLLDARVLIVGKIVPPKN